MDTLEIDYSEILSKESIKTEVGTYGKYDENGSKKYDVIKANNKAKLYFESGKTKEFSIPTLSYTITNKEVKDINEENPDTVDSISKYLLFFVISICSLLVLNIIRKRIVK